MLNGISYPKPPAAVALDIDETVHVVHGGQQRLLLRGGVGRNLPQEAPQAVGQAVIDADRY